MRAGAASCAALVTVTLACAEVSAQDAGVPTPTAMQLPFAEAAPQIDGARGELFVIVLGGADERRGPLTAARLSARRLAEQRGRELLHAFVDASVRSVVLSPSVLAALHAAIDHDARAVVTRPRIDGSANVRVAIPTARLREITGATRGLPWSG